MERSPAFQPPPGNPRFPLFDGIRALAVLAVVVCHSAELSGSTATASWGWLALSLTASVSVFFAVSGFLLYRPYASAHAGLRPAPRLGDYARRRVLRVLPGYWVALTALALLPGIAGVFSGKWWIYYGFLQSYSNGTKGGGDPVAWSLCTEVTFYLALPLLAAAAARAVRWRGGSAGWWRAELLVLAPFAAAGLVVGTLEQAQLLRPWLGTTLAGNSMWFAIGMSFAVLSVELERGGRRFGVVDWVRARSGLVWLAALATLLAGNRVFDVFGEFTRNPSPGPAPPLVGLGHALAVVLVVALVLAPAVLGATGVVRRLLASRPMAGIGVVSYGLFLWHLPLMCWIAAWHGPPDPIPGVHGGLALQRHLPGPDSLVLFVAALALALPLAVLSYRLVELPFLRLKERRLLPTWRATAQVPPGRRLTWASTSPRR